MPVDDQELRAIAFLAIRVRRATHGAGAWDEDGLMVNLRKIANRNLHLVIEGVMRHAADPKAKTPGVILGRFTPEPPQGDHPHPVTRDRQCSRCGGELPSCACTRESRAVEYESDQPPSGCWFCERRRVCPVHGEREAS
jgi:hypothetical protein